MRRLHIYQKMPKRILKKIILIIISLGFAVCGLLLLLVGILLCLGGPDPRQGNEALKNGICTLLFSLPFLLVAGLIYKYGIKKLK